MGRTPKAPVHLCLMTKATDKFPTHMDLGSFAEAADLIEGLLPSTRAEKTACINFTFNTLREGERKHVNATTTSTTALAIDLDSGPDGTALDLADLLARLEGNEALVYESASSTKALPRVRVVAALDRPLLPAEVKVARRAFAEWLGIQPGQGVESAEAISQVFFVGKLEGTRARKSWRFRGDALPAEGLVTHKFKHSWKRITEAVDTDIEVADLPRAPRACVQDYREYLETADTEISNARFYHCRQGALRGLNSDQISKAMREIYLPRHDVDTSDEWLEKQVHSTLTRVHGDPITRGEARAFAGLLAWERRRAKAKQRAFVKRMSALGSAPANDVAVEVTPDSSSSELAERYREIVKQRRAARDNPVPKSTGYDPDVDHLAKYGPPDDPLNDPPPRTYIVDALRLAPGKVSMVSGASRSGKSPLMMQMAICIAKGLPFMGKPTKQRPVLMLGYEGGDLPLRRRRRICRAMGVDPVDIPLTVRRINGVLTDTMLVDLCQAILALRDKHGVMPVVVIDTLTAANGGLDQNSAEYSEPLFALGDLGDLLDCLIVVLAHNNKTGDVSGHESIKAATQSIIKLERNELNHSEATVKCDRAPEDEFEAFQIRWSDLTDPNAKSKYSEAVAGMVSWGLLAELAAAPTEGAAKESKRSADEALWLRVDTEILGQLQLTKENNEPSWQYGKPKTWFEGVVTAKAALVRERVTALAGMRRLVLDELQRPHRYTLPEWDKQR